MARVQLGMRRSDHVVVVDALDRRNFVHGKIAGRHTNFAREIELATSDCDIRRLPAGSIGDARRPLRWPRLIGERRKSCDTAQCLPAAPSRNRETNFGCPLFRDEQTWRGRQRDSDFDPERSLTRLPAQADRG